MVKIKEINMAKKIIVDYAIWKKALYELWRTFVPAFFAVIYVQFESGVNLQDIKSWGITLLASASMAGIKAIFKYLRDYYGNGEYTKLIYKLPL